ncbi:MAG: HIRAN domain-containing protein [Bacteroidales bacterium]|nr:HIRAN domain-containing protein [Bacteroidales bacterium]
MFYAILAAVVLLALFLIFRDDHDTSYNRNDKKAQRQSEGARKQNAYSKKETSQSTTGPKTGTKAEFQGEAKKVMGMIGSIIEEVKKEAAEPLQDIQKGVQGVLDEAKAAIDKAMKEAGQKSYWTSNTEVDEQEQPEPEEEDWEDEEVDLSFLDNLDYYEDLEENSETFDVTGLRYYCTVHDCGKIVGYVKPDPSNVHDSRAQAVIRADGKLLGYIPRTQQDWYEDFNEENVVCPFVGEIELDNRGWLQAEIKVIIPTSQEYVEEEIEEEL